MAKLRTKARVAAPPRRAAVKAKARAKDTSKKQAPMVVATRAKPAKSAAVPNVYLPASPYIPPSLFNHFGVFPVQGTVRHEPAQAINTGYMLVCSAIPGYGTVGRFITYTPGSASVAVSTALTLPLMSVGFNAGGPTSSRVTKVGFRMVNSTASLYRSGRVFITHLTQRLKLPAAPSVMTGIQWDELAGSLRGMPPKFTKTTDFADFGAKGELHDKPFFCIPVDHAKYNEYRPHKGTMANIDDWFDNVALWATSTEESHPMSMLVLSWTSASSTTFLQELTISCDAQFMTRWPVDTVPGQAHIDIPSSNPSVVAKADAVAQLAHARDMQGTK